MANPNFEYGWNPSPAAGGSTLQRVYPSWLNDYGYQGSLATNDAKAFADPGADPYASLPSHKLPEAPVAPPIDGGGVPPPVPNEGGRAEFNAGGLSDMASGSALEALNAEAAGNTAGGAPGLYRGGMVTRNRLSGPDPDGPDDGFAPLKIGEGVLTAAAMRHYGKGIVGRLNKLSVSKSALR